MVLNMARTTVRTAGKRKKSTARKRKKSAARKRPQATRTENRVAAVGTTGIDWDHVFYLVRPLIVLVGVGFITQLTLYVEMEPTRGAIDVDALRRRGGGKGAIGSSITIDTSAIVDTGFVATAGLHQFFQRSQFAVDVGALLNSMLVIFCQGYCAYVGLWEGEFGLAFRITFAAWLRAFCGWFTYLPASTEYLQSDYDFPDMLTSGAVQSLILNGNFTLTPPCASTADCKVPPFVSFFSGHVSNTVMVANYLYLRGFKKCGKMLHFLNLLQIVRLLATRGHYSIDIIVGWIVAIYVTNPAERLGSYFSRATRKDLMQANSRYVPTSARWNGSPGKEGEITLRDASRSWFEAFIYADGIDRSSGIQEYNTNLEELPPFRAAVEGVSARLQENMAAQAASVTAQATRASRRLQENLPRMEWLELEELKRACIERGISLPRWLADQDGNQDVSLSKRLGQETN